MSRIGCWGSCLRKSLRIVNMLMNMGGVGMIIYSLWLLKKWDRGVSQLPLPPVTSLPRPWFIMVSLAVGIIICLSTLCGHVVSNCSSKPVLCIYVISIVSLVSLQAGVIIAIFFKMDLASELKKYIDDAHVKFESFIMFHLYLCRVITIMALVAQTNVILLAIILWIVRTEPVGQDGIFLDIPDFKYSFLVSPYSPVIDDDSRTRNQVDIQLRTHPIESYF